LAEIIIYLQYLVSFCPSVSWNECGTNAGRHVLAANNGDARASSHQVTCAILPPMEARCGLTGIRWGFGTDFVSSPPIPLCHSAEPLTQISFLFYVPPSPHHGHPSNKHASLPHRVADPTTISHKLKRADASHPGATRLAPPRITLRKGWHPPCTDKSYQRKLEVDSE
jgi:hypothetical protein